MALAPNRIAEDLRGQVAGDVLCDEVTRRLYATDASLYEITPAVVVRPRVTADVEATVRYAAAEGIAVHARGAGSGLAGGCLGPGIVVDFSRYMRRVLADEGDTVRVQPGVVHADLNRRLAASGRVFGPDPAMTEVTTLGGVAAVDSSGSRRLAYGSARQHIVGLDAVLGDGRWLTTSAAPGENRLAAELSGKLFGLLNGVRGVIREHIPRRCVNTSGYALDQSLREDHADLTQLMVGSEGTLGLITELTLRTSPLPARVGSALLTFPSLELAAEAVQVLLPMGLAACDLIDRRRLSLARQKDLRFEMLLPGAAEALLYVEVFADDEASLSERLGRVVDAMRGEDSLAAEALIAETADDRRLFADASRQLVSALHGLKGARRAVPGVEDIALPPAALPQFFLRLQEILKRREVTASVYGHVGHGQLHLRPLLDLTTRADVRRLETLASDLYDTVWLLGGTISGEHGDGLSRTPFSSRQHGPLMNVFRGVKTLFDPESVLNPGKIVPSPGARMTHAMRTTGRERAQTPPPATPQAKPAEVVELQLTWSTDEAADAARACNGCGACRATGDEVRMCPIFRYTPREEASPRAKANLMRGVLSGELAASELLLEDAKQVADLCVNCHQCRLECPAEVDIPKLMLEAKASYVATNGLRRDAWWSAHIDSLARLASGWPRLANATLHNRVARWALERTIGLASGRRLPDFANRTYLQQAATRKLHRPPLEDEKIYYFVDTYANRFDTQLATAFEKIVRRHNVGFYAPADQLPSGMAMVSQGALDLARRTAARNVTRLAEAVRDGYAIVATEPTAVLAITHEYLNLLPDEEDAQLVAANTFEACHYLWRRHVEARLQLDLSPLPYQVAHHTPCHSRALGVGSPAENLLRLIPELRLTRLEKGCSGMAGTYGLSRRHYRSSLRAGLPLLSELRSGRHQVGSTECGACRTQMEQSAPMPTIHPIKLLAASYGLMPEIKKQLAQLPAAVR
ncbi:Anaerobic glycerol-3-phosphate dehydrogenase subunit C [Botrimarina colliarenosi]|uniref:Anaerobic glycerol-3-phosphate dehydrogenase subunit C n=1 Tax=Botrimarina colliarenosi TaxID=2528001 RepID=A0A5C6A9V3_9BACT|nr:FAD-binding and (Fe-S)-binding domain-containing protein [Botrimarina colliarenosi]TWT95821.1 Anaerobic glycerol-3-phosphate dehydrogenase subunit C [Botrimarina colliarenosi]